MVGVFLDLNELIEERMEGDILFHLQYATYQIAYCFESSLCENVVCHMILFNELRGNMGTTGMYEASVNYVTS